MSKRKNKRQFRYRREKPRIAIVIEGKTELWYFQMLKRAYPRALPFNLEPELPGNGSLKEQYNRTLELADDYNMVFWIVDFDAIKGNGKINEFKEYQNKLSKKGNVVVIINHPCFEYWLLLHFEPTSKLYKNCKRVIERLKKKYLRNYNKSEGYYTRGKDIFSRLKTHLKTAIQNARNLPQENRKNLRGAMCDMHLIFEYMANLFPELLE